MINWFWSRICKRRREETQDGNSKASLCGESNLAKSLFSDILICVRGLVPLLGLELLVLPEFPLCICPGWVAAGLPVMLRVGLGRSHSSAPVPAVGTSSGNPSETKPVPQVSHLHPPETHQEVQSSGTLLQNPVGVFNSKAASSTHPLQSLILLCSSALSVISWNVFLFRAPWSF